MLASAAQEHKLSHISLITCDSYYNAWLYNSRYGKVWRWLYPHTRRLIGRPSSTSRQFSHSFFSCTSTIVASVSFPRFIFYSCLFSFWGHDRGQLATKVIIGPTSLNRNCPILWSGKYALFVFIFLHSFLFLRLPVCAGEILQNTFKLNKNRKSFVLQQYFRLFLKIIS